MVIGITGASGFVGSRMVELASQAGHRMVGFSRDASRSIPGCSEMRAFTRGSTPRVEGLDVVVNLAGESVMGVWTDRKKREIRASRIEGTRRLIEAMRSAAQRPRVLVNASAIGFYGPCGDGIIDEETPVGTGFLAEVAAEWEEEALRARECGVRVVLLRIGMVLGRGGGAMKSLVPLFRSGLGGKLGGGQQWMAWIHRDDVVGLALFAAQHETVEGPLNCVAPEPCRNADFTRVLAAAVNRPALFTAPAFLLKMALGELSGMLLDSQRIVPARATKADYRFLYPRLEDAVREVVNRER